MGLKEFCQLVIVFGALVAVESTDYKLVCYLGSWTKYRKGDAMFLVEYINPFLCTHAIYAFAKLDNNKIASNDPHLDFKENLGLGSYDRFKNMKRTNPALKTMIAIGGWDDGSTQYSEMVSNFSSRTIFVKSVVNFCQEYGFDGLDIQWKYPESTGNIQEDKHNFVQLLKELKEAFFPYGYLLSTTVSARKSNIDVTYDIPQVSKYVDFVIVCAFNMHGPWENVTGHNAPLFPRPDEVGYQRVLNVDYAINYWIANGAPKDKLILGMSSAGRSYTLAHASRNGILAPAIGPGNAAASSPGYLGFNEICLFLQQGWKEIFVDHVEAPYAYKDNQWVSYDNKKSIEIKTNYLIIKGLGGGMFWSFENDDFLGKCDGEKYPLLNILASKLLTSRKKPKPGPSEAKSSAFRSTTPWSVRCPNDRYFRDPTDCSKFYYCVQQANGEYAKRSYSCGDAAAFDQDIQTCIQKHIIAGC